MKQNQMNQQETRCKEEGKKSESTKERKVNNTYLCVRPSFLLVPCSLYFVLFFLLINLLHFPFASVNFHTVRAKFSQIEKIFSQTEKTFLPLKKFLAQT
jgi:hypothetical protein